MNATQEFFGSGDSISIEARDEHGLAAPVASRHSAGTIARALGWLSSVKQAAAPVVAAVAVTAAMGAMGTLSALGAPSDGAMPMAQAAQSTQTVQSTQKGGLQSLPGVFKMAAEPGDVSPAPDVQPGKMSVFDRSQIILEAYNKNRNSANSKISESEFGMSQKAVHDLSMSSMAPSARKYISRVDVIDKNILGIDTISPSMMPLENKDHTTTCVMQLGGYNKELSELFRKPLDTMSAKDADSLRRVVLVHESAHCEQAALLSAHTAKLEVNFTGHMNDVAESFKTTLSKSKVIDESSSAKIMMAERYADSKAVLFMAKTNMGHLNDSSTDAERSFGIDNFKQDVSLLKKMRVNEREDAEKSKISFDDHDTLHLVESLESKAIQNARDPVKWKEWSENHLGPEQMATTAGSIALGSMIAEKEEIMANAINREITELQKTVGELKTVREAIQIKLQPRDKEMAELSKNFESENKADPKKQLALGFEDYVRNFDQENLKRENSIIAAKGKDSDNSGSLTEKQYADLEIEMGKKYPAIESARIALGSRIHFDENQKQLSNTNEWIAQSSKELTSAKESMASGSLKNKLSSDNLSEDSKSFSMKSHAFWSQSKSASGEGRTSFLQESKARENPVRAQSTTQTQLSPVVSPVSLRFMRMLGAQPSKSVSQPIRPMMSR